MIKRLLLQWLICFIIIVTIFAALLINVSYRRLTITELVQADLSIVILLIFLIHFYIQTLED